MTTPLSGKVALITGGSKGIGAAISQKLAALGASIVINYSSDRGAADEVVSKIGAERAVAVQADASSVKSIEGLVAETVAKFKKIDIVIACAGILLNKDLENTSEEDFDRTMALNVKGPFFLAQKAAPHMAPGSHIILFSTSLCAASMVTPNYMSYVTSKGAVEQMTRLMSKDLARKGISVNAVAPGPTGTDLFFNGKSEQVLNMIKGFSPYNRIGEPDEIASVVAFLSGQDSSWMTGQVVRVNGGMA